MRKAIFAGVLLLAGVASVTASLATDVLPPAWRGQANTTLQAWSFDTAANPAVLTLDENIYGTPSATIHVTDTGFPQETFWKATNGNGHVGVWRIHGSDYLLLDLPNTPTTDPSSSKEIWLQITYSAGTDEAEDVKPEIQTLPSYASLELIQSTVVDSLYYRDVYRIRLVPNPTEERIAILPRYSNVYIDEIVVDTICIPEPATMLILGLGAVLLRKRK
jgi:hypothetical protein